MGVITANPDISLQRNIGSPLVLYLADGLAIFGCVGSPEGVIAANKRSIALSDDGSLYYKTTDEVSTGWVVLGGGGGGGSPGGLINQIQLNDGAGGFAAIDLDATVIDGTNIQIHTSDALAGDGINLHLQPGGSADVSGIGGSLVLDVGIGGDGDGQVVIPSIPSAQFLRTLSDGTIIGVALASGSGISVNSSGVLVASLLDDGEFIIGATGGSPGAGTIISSSLNVTPYTNGIQIELPSSAGPGGLTNQIQLNNGAGGFAAIDLDATVIDGANIQIHTSDVLTGEAINLHLQPGDTLDELNGGSLILEVGAGGDSPGFVIIPSLPDRQILSTNNIGIVSGNTLPASGAVFVRDTGAVDGVALNDGEFLIGATGGNPNAGTITSGTLTVTPGAGSLQIEIPSQLQASPPTGGVQFNDGSNGFLADNDFIWDTASGTLQLGAVGERPANLQLRSDVSGSINLTVNEPASNFDLQLPDAAPNAVGDVLAIQSIAGAVLVAEWVTPSSGNVLPGTAQRIAFYPGSASEVDDAPGFEYNHSSSQDVFIQAQSTTRLPLSLKAFSSGQIAGYFQCLDESDVFKFGVSYAGGFGAAGDSYFSLTGSSTTFPRRLQLQNIASGNAFRLELNGESDSLQQVAGGKLQFTSKFGTKFVGCNNSSFAQSFQAGSSSDPAVEIVNGQTTVIPLVVNAITSTSVNALSVQLNSSETFGVLPSGVYKSASFTVAGLPSASSVGAGARAFVTDALSPVALATVTGGGAVKVPVYSDGSNWLVG